MDMEALLQMVCAPAEVASVPVLRARVGEWLRAAGADEDMYQAGLLSATEILSNAVNAACDPAQRIGLVLECGLAGFRIVVDGPGTGPTIAQLRGRGAGPEATHGRGLALVRGLGGSLGCEPSQARFVCSGDGCHGPADDFALAEVRHVVHCTFPSVASLV
jgi:anti-sigma regulatory factor (Ser/Thr protein kinase)